MRHCRCEQHKQSSQSYAIPLHHYHFLFAIVVVNLVTVVVDGGVGWGDGSGVGVGGGGSDVVAVVVPVLLVTVFVFVAVVVVSEKRSVVRDPFSSLRIPHIRRSKNRLSRSFSYNGIQNRDLRDDCHSGEKNMDWRETRRDKTKRKTKQQDYRAEQSGLQLLARLTSLPAGRLVSFEAPSTKQGETKAKKPHTE